MLHVTVPLSAARTVRLTTGFQQDLRVLITGVVTLCKFVWCRSGQGAALAVRGSPIEVDLALTQDDARQLAGASKAQPGGKDNRNLYLVRTSLPSS